VYPVLLERGATYVGNFVLPVHDDAQRVVTVRTGGDVAVPPEGDRMTPEGAAALAKFRSPNSSPVLSTAPGARGWRIALLEISGEPRRERRHHRAGRRLIGAEQRRQGLTNCGGSSSTSRGAITG
jgi:hypothetical protein